MNLRHISLNSLWRRKSRMLFLLIGLTIAVSTVILLIHLSRAMNADIAHKLDEYGANLLIVPRSEDLSLSYGGMTVSGVAVEREQLHDDDVARIRTIRNSDNISIVAPKLIDVADINGRRVLVVGVDFPAETAMKPWWRISGAVPGSGSEGLIGSEAATKLGLVVGDEVSIRGNRFRVSGALAETGSQDDGLVFIDRRTAQRLFNRPDAISLIEVAARCYDCPIEEIVAQTSEKLPGARVTAIRQAIASKMEATHRFERFSLGISVIILVIGALIAFTTMSGSVNERVREIGVFRSIGFRQRHILQIIFLEALVLSAIAGMTGFLLGWGMATYAAPLAGGADLSIAPDPLLALLALALSVAVGIAATVQPALKAARLDPWVALRSL